MTQPSTTYPTETHFDERLDATLMTRPLTTVFTPPPGCPSIYPFSSYIFADDESTDCVPPDLNSAGRGAGAYYSPGICPVGYTPGCSAWDSKMIAAVSREWPESAYSTLTVPDGVTAQMCMPSGFACFELEVYYWGFDNIAIRVRGFEIRWHETDLIYLETHPMSPGVTPWTSLLASESTGSAAPTGLSNSDSASDESGSRGLSQGAVAGLAIGCIIIGFVIAGLVFFMCLRRRRVRQVSVEQPMVVDGGGPRLLGHTTVVMDAIPPDTTLDKSPSPRTEIEVGALESPSTTYMASSHAASGYHEFGQSSVATVPASHVHAGPGAVELESSERQEVVSELYGDHNLQKQQQMEQQQPDPAVSPNQQAADVWGSESSRQEEELIAEQKRHLETKRQTLMALREVQDAEERLEARMRELRNRQ